METGYILIACGFAGLAIAYNLWGRSRSKPGPVRAWVTRELYRGDLRALSDTARGHFNEVSVDQLDRLRERGFVASGFRGLSRVTIKGRLALMLRGSASRNNSARELG